MVRLGLLSLSLLVFAAAPVFAEEVTIVNGTHDTIGGVMVAPAGVDSYYGVGSMIAPGDGVTFDLPESMCEVDIVVVNGALMERVASGYPLCSLIVDRTYTIR
jgi:hypothetical protein